MKCTAIFLFFGLNLVTFFTYGVVGGQILTPKEAEDLRALVPLKIRSSLGVNRGMAVHIGNGALLTAWHVIHGMGTFMGMELFDLTSRSIGGADASMFEIDWPQSDRSKKINTANMELPELDVVIINTNGKLREKIQSLPILEIHDFSQDARLDHLYAAGWGLDSFESPSSRFLVKKGRVILNDYDETGLYSRWKHGDATVALRSGDSGTPLLQLGEDGRYTLLAVTSIGTTTEGYKKTGIAQNKFVRLDNETIVHWMRSVAWKKINSSRMQCKVLF